MSDKIAVSRIEIKIGKDVLKLSIAQMQELKEVLNKTFPDDKTVYIDRQPYYIPPPIYIEPSVYPVYPWNQWITTCGDSTTTTLEESNTLCLELCSN